MTKTLLEECQNLGLLQDTASAVIKYTCAITDGSLQKESARYVMRPENFVTFEPHYQRACNLTVTLRGNPEEFEASPELPLKRSMHGYATFSLEDVKQLYAATSYIRRAKQIFERGRTRIPSTPKTIEH